MADEDIVLLLSAALGQFEGIDPIVKKALEVAGNAGVIYFSTLRLPVSGLRPRDATSIATSTNALRASRYAATQLSTNGRTPTALNELSLPRALALLAVPMDAWEEPARQQYVQQILQFFEKRAANIAHRGALVRLLIGKTTPRVDVCEIGSAQFPAETIVQRLLERNGQDACISPDLLCAEPTREVRLRRLVNHASTYRRDTGIDGRYLGFPFLVFQDARPGSTSRVPRIAPILLWPIRVDMEAGVHASAKISFDRDREEVRKSGLRWAVGSGRSRSLAGCAQVSAGTAGHQCAQRR